MDIKSQLRKSLLSAFVLWSFLLASLPVTGQVIVPGNIAGGSGKYIIVGVAKKGSYSSRRTSSAKRTQKQRSSTRRQVVRQSQVVAKNNRVRRDIDEVTPEEYQLIDIKRMSKEEASKVLAGAGEYYVTRDEVDNAVTYLEGAIELDENNDDAKLALSEVYTTLGDRALVKADEYTDLAAKSAAESDSANEKKNSALATIETEKAEKYYKRAVFYDTKNPSAYVGLGQFYDAQGKDDLAKQNYEIALGIDPDLTEVKGPLGIIYFQEGEIAKAEQLIAESLAPDPNNAEAQFFLGLVRYKQNENEGAIEALERSVSIDNESAETHYYLGATYNRLDRDNDAIEQFERAVALDPRFVNAWFDLGVAYYNKGLYEKAIDAFEKAKSFNNDRTEELKNINNETYANLAEAYRQAGKVDLAISIYRIAVSRVTDSPELFTTYGFALAERGLWKPAIDAFRKAAELDSQAPSTTTNLGWAHYKSAESYRDRNMKADMESELRAAKTILEQAIALYPRNDRSYRENLAAAEYYLGSVLNQLSEHDRAINVLRDANDLSDEKWAEAVNELGIAYRSKRNYKDAIRQFKRAVDIQEQWADAWYNLAEAEFQSGDEKEARKIQERLRRLDPRLAERLERVIFRGRES